VIATSTNREGSKIAPRKLCRRLFIVVSSSS
jgi:hypothetical protein